MSCCIDSHSICYHLFSVLLILILTIISSSLPSSHHFTDTDEPDILDEAISYFRANVLFRTFQSQGPADLTLAYFTAFIAEVLRFFAKQKTKEDAKKKITELSMSQNFLIPGDKALHSLVSSHSQH